MPPPHITANPNRVTISVWSLKPRPTTISWDTGSNAVKGKVYLSTAPGASTLFDDGGKSEGVRSGAKTQAIELGKNYLFLLKRADNPNTILATVLVEGRELLGLPVGTLKRLPLLQGITNLRVLPGVDSVRIMFRTRQPTIPFIEIKNAITQDLAGAVLPFLRGYNQVHEFAFPLAQETDFSFHILAPSMAGYGVNKPAEASGLFRTGSRKAEIFFDHLFVHNDGDPDLLGDGDLAFVFGAGDVETGDQLGPIRDFHDDIAGGENRWLNRSIAIERAPIQMWVQVIGTEGDGVPGGIFGEGVYPSFAPEGSRWHVIDDREYATVTRWFDLSGAAPAPQEIPFSLRTGPTHMSFTMNCRLRMEAHDGAVLQTSLKWSARPHVPAQRVALLADTGEPAQVSQARGTAHVLQLTPNGALYRTSPMSMPTARTMPPKLLSSEVPGPLTVVASNDLLHLFAIGADGHVLYQAVCADGSYSADTQGDTAWRSIGGCFVAPVAAAVARDRIELFGLSAEGVVAHITLTDNRGSGEWETVGEGIAGSLNAFVSSRDEVGLVAIGRNGEILHQQWPAVASKPGARAWRSLGPAPRGTLTADFIDDVLVLASLADDDTVQAAPWRDYPDQAPKLVWQVLGTLNSLHDARFSLLTPTNTSDARVHA